MTRIFPSSSFTKKAFVWRTGALLVTALLLAACGSPSSQTSHSDHQTNSQANSRANSQAAANPTPRVPAFISNLAEAGPLPAVLDPRQFTDPVVVKAYRFAAENPEIFAQQPCYCHCDTSDGHKGLLDCFATTHGAT